MIENSYTQINAFRHQLYRFTRRKTIAMHNGDYYADPDSKDFIIKQARKKAAVLILFAFRPDPQILLTVRARHLKDHAGQIAFPGGKLIDGETIEQTALRETYEEIGVPAQNIETIGKLGEYASSSGFKITPVLGLMENNQPLIYDKNEVEEAFYLPLSHIADQSVFSTHALEWQGRPRKFFQFHYQTYRVWGVTAALLKLLVQGMFEDDKHNQNISEKE